VRNYRVVDVTGSKVKPAIPLSYYAQVNGALRRKTGIEILSLLTAELMEIIKKGKLSRFEVFSSVFEEESYVTVEKYAEHHCVQMWCPFFIVACDSSFVSYPLFCQEQMTRYVVWSQSSRRQSSKTIDMSIVAMTRVRLTTWKSSSI